MQLLRELIVDNFAGGGGASTGIELATGRSVDIAINHDTDAITMHQVNHPETTHYCESVWDVNPREITQHQPVAVMWLSPDCKHFSKAKGGVPVEKKIRGLAWIAIRWAATVKPRVIILENVEEFKTWGPLLENGKPCPDKKGTTFASFVRALERQGYKVDHKTLHACDFGTPTIRKRLFLVARRDGQAITWPSPTHGKPDSSEVKKGTLLPYRTAAEIIDFSIPAPSIFDRTRPLAKNTLKRIAKGITRYVLDEPEPFIISHNRLLVPFITECAQVKGGHFALVSGFVAKNYTGVVGHSFNKPLSTVTTVDHHSLVTSHILTMRNGCIGQSLKEPVAAITSGGRHFGEIRTLIKYYGTGEGQSIYAPLHTVTTKDRFALVTIKSVRPPFNDDILYASWWCARFMEDNTDTPILKTRIPYPRKQWVHVGGGAILYDLGLRMLQPRELYNAQGFPADYIIDRDINGKKITKTSQVARCGNSVCPPVAEHLIRANLPEMCSGGELYNASNLRALRN